MTNRQQRVLYLKSMSQHSQWWSRTTAASNIQLWCVLIGQISNLPNSHSYNHCHDVTEQSRAATNWHTSHLQCHQIWFLQHLICWLPSVKHWISLLWHTNYFRLQVSNSLVYHCNFCMSCPSADNKRDDWRSLLFSFLHAKKPFTSSTYSKLLLHCTHPTWHAITGERFSISSTSIKFFRPRGAKWNVSPSSRAIALENSTSSSSSPRWAIW